MLAFRSGVNPRRIWSILNGEGAYVALSRADELLTAIEETAALSDGRVRVYSNPQISIERWRQKLAVAGVTDENQVIDGHAARKAKPCLGCDGPAEEQTPGCHTCQGRHSNRRRSLARHERRASLTSTGGPR